jgi:mono/diheme cytochrome c family protein
VIAATQVEVVPGSAARGEDLFSAKGCVVCHAVDGEGGTEAPDLGRRAADLYTPDGLAAAMWTHAPRMWEAMREASVDIPALSSPESADLFSFFYSRLYFTPPGDPARGRRAFADKNCIVCHPLDRVAGNDSIGPPVSDWAPVRSPIVWAERMWSHAGEMYDRVEESGLRWPRFTEQEMVDVLIYLADLPTARSGEALFEPGDPETGRGVFTSRCETCHGFRPVLPGRVDLLERATPLTMMGYAAAMWNHAPRMEARGDGNLPTLEDGAMNDVVAYLFAERYFTGYGDPATGERVYREKGCIVCHETERARTGAPELITSTEVHSPITMTASLWNHGPDMLDALENRGMTWPIFEDSEMSDLIAYLNSRLVRLVADGEE